MTDASAPEAPTVDREAEKTDRFRRVAARRANNALKNIDMLTRTANAGNYSYNDEQVEKIVGTLRTAVDRLEAAYAGSSKSGLKVEL